MTHVTALAKDQAASNLLRKTMKDLPEPVVCRITPFLRTLVYKSGASRGLDAEELLVTEQ